MGKTTKGSWLAFSRTDLMVVIATAVAIIGGAFFFLTRSRHVSKETQCNTNLKALGAAMAMYEQANNEKLPYAFIRYSQAAKNNMTWDALIYPYVPLGPRGLTQKHFLQCPADTV